MTSPVNVIVLGAGCRGEILSKFASIHPTRMKVVAVADPRKFARTKLQQQHKIDNENVFEDWPRVVEREKFADAVLICTPDRLHKDPAVAFAKKGYHILLEKPLATTPEDCTAIVEACTQSGVMLSVGHVLRYDPVIHKIKELIDAGDLGEVIHIQHLEPVGFYHFAHSFVRGNWRNEAESSFALLSKSCHDIDLIHHWAGARRCVKVSSFGSVSHFQKKKKPTGAADRCLDCPVERDCPYSACKIYLDTVKQGHTGWPVSVICPSSFPDIESVTEALRTGPYGRCVYECDNDVCTNQVVNMEFEGGLTAAFSMVAFTEEICKRKTKICGSRGELSYDGDEIRVFDFLSQRSTKHTASSDVPCQFGLSGHGVADYHFIHAFISAVEKSDPSLIRSGPEETLMSHLLVFEAERSRLESRVVFCGDATRG
ncbi:putative oxidoreductase YteT [Cololabis saira]|uniref:putative oxidoreductase YteT n=1 Tax=Cololabis saira TaxID=129043 RepID=UPI002AD32225|nr:putative oxidoreductase YteT [Cololabis saira]XP_061592511.1 putative oxidoreductase YteT [Cololabis saira]